MILGISGASGVTYGIRLLQALHGRCRTHLVLTDAARKIIEIETSTTPAAVESLADLVHDPGDFTAPIASGSYPFDAMVIAPCSMRTLAGVAAGLSDTLLTRAADVCLKERRRLVLVTRETPLNLVHLKNMVYVTEAGGIIMPACPAFYGRPENLEDAVDAIAGRVLDLLGLQHELYPRWGKP